jgi:hypothetical protein
VRVLMRNSTVRHLGDVALMRASTAFAWAAARGVARDALRVTGAAMRRARATQLETVDSCDCPKAAGAASAVPITAMHAKAAATADTRAKPGREAGCSGGRPWLIVVTLRRNAYLATPHWLRRPGPRRPAS